MIKTDNKRVFCAIDTKDIELAVSLTARVKEYVRGIKLGLEFFSTHGPSGLSRLQEEGVPIFLDLKFFDIPNTVSEAVKAVVPYQPAMITLHATGGSDMLKAAVGSSHEVAASLGLEPPLLLGVTVLTSLGRSDLAGTGVKGSLDDQVLRLAALSEASGLDGVICSAHELVKLRALCGRDFKLVVPGIRPGGTAADDQKRIMTPSEAMVAGADYLVVGRPITQAADVGYAAQQISTAVDEALER